MDLLDTQITSVSVKDISTPQLDMSSRDKVPNSMRSQDEDKT